MTTPEEKRGAIASRLAIARQQAGLSQGQVAKLLGFHRPTISEIEAGRRRVAAEELSRLAEIYGVGISWLTGDEKQLDADDKVLLAARELEKLKPDDLNQVLDLLNTLKRKSGTS